MTRRQRLILFYSCLGAFLILSAMVIIYALGYRYDFANAELQKTGSLRLSVSTSAEVFINGKSAGSTSVFSGSFSKNRLAPQDYHVIVKADGYRQWQKIATIQEGLLTDLTSIYLIREELPVMDEDPAIASLSFVFDDPVIDIDDADALASKINIPISAVLKAEEKGGNWYVLAIAGGRTNLYSVENDKISTLGENVKDFVFDKSGSKIMWFSQNEVWVQWLKNTSYQPLRAKGAQEYIFKTVKPIVKAYWFGTDEHIIVASGSEVSLVELDGRGGRNIAVLLRQDDIKDMAYDAEEDEILVAYSKAVVSISLK